MKRLYPLFVIFAVVIILYHPVLTTYFSQDDFFHFKVSQTDGTLTSFINLFGFHPFSERKIAFYRPISRELLFNPYYFIFGLNPLPFRIFVILIHLLNVYLVFVFIQKLFNKKWLSYFVAFFFGITSANVALLYYLAGGIQTLLVTTFILSCLIFFMLNRKIVSFAFFLLAIGSHELAIIVPFLLAGFNFIYHPFKKAVKEILKLWPFLLVIILLLYLDITKIGFSSAERQYQLVLNVKTAVNSFAWYFSWGLGLPEMLVDFLQPGFKLNPNLMRYWGNYFAVIFPTFFISIIFIVLSIIYLIIKNRQTLLDKKFWLLLFWFPLGLLPVIFLPLHKSTHYLAPVLAPLWAIIGFLAINFFSEFKKGHLYFSYILLGIFIASLIFLSAFSIFLGNKTYWASSRGKLAEKLINLTKTKYPSLPKGSAIYFTNDPTYPYVAKDWGGTSKQASLVLNGSDALQLLYKDPTLRVYYQDLGVPSSSSEKNIYSLVAKIY